MEPTFSTWFRARRTSCAFCKCSLFAAAVALSTEITVPSERPITFSTKLLFILSMQISLLPVFFFHFFSLEWIKLSRYLSFTNVAANWTELFALVVRLSCNLKAFHSFCEAKWKIIMLNVFFFSTPTDWWVARVALNAHILIHWTGAYKDNIVQNVRWRRGKWDRNLIN